MDEHVVGRGEEQLSELAGAGPACGVGAHGQDRRRWRAGPVQPAREPAELGEHLLPTQPRVQQRLAWARPLEQQREAEDDRPAVPDGRTHERDVPARQRADIAQLPRAGGLCQPALDIPRERVEIDVRPIAAPEAGQPAERRLGERRVYRRSGPGLRSGASVSSGEAERSGPLTPGSFSASTAALALSDIAPSPAWMSFSS